MTERRPHPEALVNFEMAHLPESKILYGLRDPDKRRPFAALGFGEENWEELRDAIVEGLPFHPAVFHSQDQFGTRYTVDMLVNGPAGREAPVRTGWIYDVGRYIPRLITLRVLEQRRWERGR